MEVTKKYIIREKVLQRILLGIIVLWLLLLIYPIPILPFHKYILFTLGLLCICYFNSINSNTFELEKQDVFWIGYFFISLASYFWAINKSLVWSQAFIFLGFYCLVLLIRSEKNQKKHIGLLKKSFRFSFFFLIIIYVSQYLLATILNSPQYIHGINGNYISTLLLMFLPFILLEESRSKKWELFIFIIVFLVCLLASSRGSLLIFFCFFILWFRQDIKKQRIPIFFLPLIFILGTLYYLDKDSIIGLIRDIGSIHDELRFIMIKNSIKLWLENPIIGIGANNWLLEAYKYPYESYNSIYSCKKLYHIDNHNLYSKLLVEIGIIGVILFLYPFVIKVKNSLFRFKELDGIQKASLVTIIIYLICTNFYRDATSYTTYFSGIEFLAFLSFGLLKSKKGSFKISKRQIIYLPILLLIFWHFIININYYNYLHCKEKIKNEPDVLHSNSYIKLYNANWYTTVYSANDLISFNIAGEYMRFGDWENAKKWYEISYTLAPYNDRILLDYGIYLMRNGQLQKSEKLLNRIYAMQDSYWQINLYLAELAILKKEYDKATKYLNDICLLDKPQINKQISSFRQKIKSNQ